MPTSLAILNVQLIFDSCFAYKCFGFDFCLFQKMDQRICIKFCVKNKIKCVDAFRMLTVAYGEATLDRSNVYRWYKMFSEGREDVNDEERAGRPSTSTTDENIDEVKKIVLANHGSPRNWLLHHDNAPAHTSLLVREFLAKNNTLMMPQPPYSPDLAPCDFFLFPQLKRPMKGRRYATIEEIKTASKEELNKITKNDFLKCFEDWKKRWHKCIISDGDYFEGDKIHIHE
ncbi:MOS1T transposase, partial [Acromyrmex heyeri]